MTTDLDGQRAFVMTMRAREQDIRRDKAASNICTNQALLALAASIYLATIGPHGLRDVAALGAAHAAELERALAAAGAPRLHPGPYLNEFAVRVPDAAGVHARLLRRGVLAGLVLADAEPDDPSLADGLLVCATEVTTPDDIARFAAALADELAGTTASTPIGGSVSVTGPRLQPTIFERGHPGRGGGKIPHPPADALDRLPAEARRVTPPALPEMNEPDVVRHYVNLSQLNFAVDTGFYPLGSCTMKFNPKLNEWAARLPGFADLHPLAPDEAAQGTLRLLWELEAALAAISGMRAVTLQPAAGAQGELTGILMIRAYHRERGDIAAGRGAGSRQFARHEPGHSVDGRLPHDHDPVRCRRRRGRRCVPGRPWPAYRGGDDHQPVDAGPVRVAHRRSARRGPRGGRPGLHGRGEPQCDPRAVQAGRGRLRCHALQRPQDVQHAAWRRRAGRRAGRGGGAAGPVPALAARPARSRTGRSGWSVHDERPSSIGRSAQLRRQHRRPRARVRLHPGPRRVRPARGQRRRRPGRELPEGAAARGVSTSRTPATASTSSSHRQPRSSARPGSGRWTSPSA